MRRRLGAATALLLVACSCTRKLEVGSIGAAALAGTWRGTIETQELEAGAPSAVVGYKTMTMIVTLGRNDTLGLAVTFGDSGMRPELANGDTAYLPPDFHGTDAFYDGFSYTGKQVVFDETTLNFGLETNEYWGGWCNLQSATYAPVSGYEGTAQAGCLPPGAIVDANGPPCTWWDSEDAVPTPVDCGKAKLCGPDSVCACVANFCTYAQTNDNGVPGSGVPNTALSLRFDRDQQALDGTAAPFGDAVHLTRDP
jgi:hypothetical protein